MQLLQWVVKASKLCNLRCGYCYEWDSLDDPRRMSLALWERVLVAARELHAQEARRFGQATTTLLLHGGEPLILPQEYLQAVMDLRARLLPDRDAFRFATTTNLFKVSDAMLDLLVREEIEVTVSFDVVPGVRVTLNGRETEADVWRNVERLQKAGVRVIALAVIAKHTAPDVARVYAHFADRGMPVRLRPLRAGPETRPYDRFECTDDELSAAMEKAFALWLEGGRPIHAEPFASALETVVEASITKPGRTARRRDDGESVIIVQPDGALNRTDEAHGMAPFGSLADMTLAEIFASERYRASLAEDDALIEATCGSCPYAGACDGSAAFAEAAVSVDGARRCATTYPLHRAVERYLASRGFGGEAIAARAAERA